jgi:hypothetical protein
MSILGSPHRQTILSASSPIKPHQISMSPAPPETIPLLSPTKSDMRDTSPIACPHKPRPVSNETLKLCTIHGTLPRFPDRPVPDHPIHHWRKADLSRLLIRLLNGGGLDDFRVLCDRKFTLGRSSLAWYVQGGQDLVGHLLQRTSRTLRIFAQPVVGPLH